MAKPKIDYKGLYDRTVEDAAEYAETIERLERDNRSLRAALRAHSIAMCAVTGMLHLEEVAE